MSTSYKLPEGTDGPIFRRSKEFLRRFGNGDGIIPTKSASVALLRAFEVKSVEVSKT